MFLYYIRFSFKYSVFEFVLHVPVVYCWVVSQCMNLPQFVYSPDDGHLYFRWWTFVFSPHSFCFDYFRISILELLFQIFLFSFLWSLSFLKILILLHFNYCYLFILSLRFFYYPLSWVLWALILSFRGLTHEGLFTFVFCNFKLVKF